MPAYTTETITPKYHDAIVDWQKKNFPEFQFLEDNWTKFYPAQTPYQLFAKVGKLNSDQILFGRMAAPRHPPSSARSSSIASHSRKLRPMP